VEVFQKDLLKQKQTLEGALKVSGLEQCSIDERTFQLQNIKTALKIDQELSMLRAKYLELQSSQIKAQTALNEQQTEQQAFVQKKIEMEASLKATTNQREILQSETKKTKKAIFEKLLALELNFELDESLNEKLKNYLQQLEEQEKEMLFSQKVILELQNNKIQWEATSRELGKQDKQVRQRLQEMTEVQQDLQKKKRDLHPEADQFLEIYRDTQKDCEQKKQAFGNLEKQKLELEFKSNQLQESLQKNTRQMPSQIEEFKHVIEAFKTSLQKQGFEDQEEVEQLFAMKENCLKLKVWNEQHESREREIEIAQAQLLERKLETPEKDQKICESEHLQLQEQLESLQKTMGALQREKEQELQWLKQFQDQIESSQKAEKDYLEWEQLRRLIGSADGSAFRRIAQRITLKFLLKLANRHLKTILERYQLVEESDREMGIILKDRYQAMSSRPMETLSGGERFMISLALALALSDISRRHQSIESLFIDEGFGALDVHALDRVLESLDKIRQMGRTIGIISHIEALKERIPVQIQVHPLQGGSSAVKVVGAI
jgi:exonuclease SbcC